MSNIMDEIEKRGIDLFLDEIDDYLKKINNDERDNEDKRINRMAAYHDARE